MRCSSCRWRVICCRHSDGELTFPYARLSSSVKRMSIQHGLLCRGDNLAALQLLPELGFIPTDGFRLQRCLEAVAALHPALTPRIPSLLVATARALAAAGQVRAFATEMRVRFSELSVNLCLFSELNGAH